MDMDAIIAAARPHSRGRWSDVGHIDLRYLNVQLLLLARDRLGEACVVSVWCVCVGLQVRFLSPPELHVHLRS